MKKTSPATCTPTANRRHRAFTLVELLVVIAIIGVLLALMLPAVQAARESARQVSCRNNLRQIALGVLQYTETHEGDLPSLWRADYDNTWAFIEPWEYFSWRVEVLPHLELTPLHDALQMSSTPLANVNRSSVAKQVPLFQCSSTPSTPRIIESLGPVGLGPQDVQLGASDYSAIHDVASQFEDERLPAMWRSLAQSEVEEGDGAFPAGVGGDRTSPAIRQKNGKLSMTEDGLANTALLVEQAGKPQHYDRRRVAEHASLSEGAWATAEFSSFYAAGINVDNQTGIYGFHPGALVAMGDASVHMFSEDMEVEVITALLSRNGDEIISAEDWQ